MSGVFKGVGEATADKIVDYLGDNPLDIFKNDIDKILTVPKVPLKKLQAIKDAWILNTETNEIIVFLKQYGITSANVHKIYEKYGNKTIAILRKNPYLLIKDIEGIGFRSADKIALSMGLAKDSSERIKECIKYVIEQSIIHGHCYLLRSQIIKETNALLEQTLTDLINDSLEDLEKIKEIKRVTINESERFYNNAIYNHEQKCAEVICRLICKGEKEFNYDFLPNVELSDQQNDAVIGALSNYISILTGGPGAGKTYTTKTIVKALLEAGYSVVICAPTGKAAQRSKELIGFDNTLTIHRLLQYSYEINGFEYNEDNPLTYDYIIVEESSMINTLLMSSLLRAIGSDTQVLFVGDHDQLPPISAGNPFKDMIFSNMIPTYKLTKIFRQGLDSNIIKFAHEINNGIVPQIQSPLVTPSLWTDKIDCLFIDSGFVENHTNSNQYSKYTTMYYNMNIIQMLIKLYTETIKKYRNILDVQILIPKRIGDLGTNVINLKIQDAVNPLLPEENEIIIGEKRFRLNDKVIHVVNNYKLGDGVFNGEIGVIVGLNKLDSTCKIKFDNREVEYARKDMYDLELAYAITIHKSQGSEFEAVILPLMNEYNIMLHRPLIYTGLTRAKKLAVFLGERQALAKSVKSIDSNKRQTSLSEIISDKNIFVKDLVS